MLDMNIRYIHGEKSHAILTWGRSGNMTVLLDDDAPPAESLRLTAAEMRAKAEKLLRRADLIDHAASIA